MDLEIGEAHTINQHYVPQFLISRFADPETERVFVFDKHRSVKFRTHVRNILAERKFYDFKIANTELTLEKWLNQIETPTAHILETKISRQRGIRDLQPEDFVVLAKFIATQISRTKNRKLDQKETYAKYIELLTRKFPAQQLGSFVPEEEQDSGAFFAELITKSEYMVPYLLKKKWTYQYSATDLYLSDNPISMVNGIQKNTSHWGNIGLDVKGIEIYFPISSREVITLMCEKVFAEAATAFDSNPAATDQSSNFRIRNFVNSVRRRIPTELPEETVLNHNSSQVVYAEQFVICEHDDFELVEDMILEPRLKHGPRTQVG